MKELWIAAHEQAVEEAMEADPDLSWDQAYHSDARTERAAAAEDRARRYGTAIRIHEQNAIEYEARAAALEEADDAEPFQQGPDTQL